MTVLTAVVVRIFDAEGMKVEPRSVWLLTVDAFFLSIDLGGNELGGTFAISRTTGSKLLEGEDLIDGRSSFRGVGVTGSIRATDEVQLEGGRARNSVEWRNLGSLAGGLDGE